MMMIHDTTPFETAHGRKPRGTGWWAFGIGTRNPAVEDVFFAPAGTYAQAKKAAEAEAKCRHPEAKTLVIFTLS